MSHADIIALIKKIITKFLKTEFSIYIKKLEVSDMKKLLIDFLRELHRMRIIESYEKNYSIYWHITEKSTDVIANALKIKMIDDISAID